MQRHKFLGEANLHTFHYKIPNLSTFSKGFQSPSHKHVQEAPIRYHQVCTTEHSVFAAVHNYEIVRISNYPTSNRTNAHIAGSDYPSNAGITYLDANENAFGPSIAVKEVLSSCGPSVTIQSSLDPQALQLHRYPDP